MNILWINCCIRGKDVSRTDKLSRSLLEKICDEKDTVTEEDLTKGEFAPMLEKDINSRTELIAKNNYESCEFEAAKRLADADVIVMSAPFWDLSFPAELKSYIEHITVNGVTFKYSDSGMPQGLCKGKKLYYVTTAGGYIFDNSFSFGYVKALFGSMFGIKEFEFIKAEGLDIVGNNPEKILSEAINDLPLKCYN